MKKHIAMLTALLLSAALCACDNSEKTAADINYLYGQISEISGNDLTLLVAEYDEADEKTEEKGMESSDSSEDSKSQNRGNKGNRPQGGFDFGNMPEGFDPENMPEGGFNREDMPEGFDPENMPEGGFNRGNMPEGFDPENMSEGGFNRENMPEGFNPENMPEGGFNPENMPEGGFNREDMPEGFDPENMPEGGFDRGNSKAPQSNVKGYTLTGEEQQIRIPVGAIVTTALGVKTDFDVLKTGDMIKYTTKKDDDGNEVITAVWIVE